MIEFLILALGLTTFLGIAQIKDLVEERNYWKQLAKNLQERQRNASTNEPK